MTKIDDVDLGIILFLSDNPRSTSTSVAKNIFKPQDSRKLIKIDNMIRYRLKRFIGDNIVSRSNTRPVLYTINQGKVFFSDGELTLQVDGKPLKMDLGYFLVIDGEEEVILRSIDAYEIRHKIGPV